MVWTVLKPSFSCFISSVCVFVCLCMLVGSCPSGNGVLTTSCLPVAQVLDYAIEADQLIEKYETLASELLQWIEQTIFTLNDRQLANSLSGVQNQLQAFNTYRTVEKPPKWEPTCQQDGEGLLGGQEWELGQGRAEQNPKKRTETGLLLCGWGCWWFERQW